MLPDIRKKERKKKKDSNLIYIMTELYMYLCTQKSNGSVISSALRSVPICRWFENFLGHFRLIRDELVTGTSLLVFVSAAFLCCDWFLGVQDRLLRCAAVGIFDWL